MRRASLLAAAVLLLTATASAQSDEKAAAEPVLKQLDAFRHNDYDTAYGFASAEIRQQFDRPAFERMCAAGIRRSPTRSAPMSPAPSRAPMATSTFS